MNMLDPKTSEYVSILFPIVFKMVVDRYGDRFSEVYLVYILGSIRI